MSRAGSVAWAGIAAVAAATACGGDEQGGGGAAGGATTTSGTAGGGAAGAGGASSSGTGGASSSGTAGSGPACADLSLLVETPGTATVVAMPAASEPAAGTPFAIAQTGTTVMRVSDASDPSATSSEYTNGYSRWSAANVTGEYVIAFGTDGRSVVYRLADRSIVRALEVGEPNELHWDATAQGGTETQLYYRTGAELRRIDVLSGNDVLVHDFTAEYPGTGAVLNGVEGAPSNDMRYWAFQICGGMTGGGQCTGILDIVVYDKQADAIAGRLSDVESNIRTPNFVGMSPSGSRIVVGSCKENGSTPAPWNGPYAWSRDFSGRVRLGTNCTHSGWAWGSSGQEYYVGFDSCGASNEEVTFTCDHIMAVDVNDPSGWANRFAVLHAGDMGWGVGNHIGRVYRSTVPGWFFVSTYTDSDAGWAANQLFFVELADVSTPPRLWRVAPTLNAYQGYWSEAFASLDFAAQHVYWGANWGGAGNLELYQATLCDKWWEALASR